MANQTTLNEKKKPSRRISSSAISTGRAKSLEEALKAAEQIRNELSGRTHSDSTELVAEDRQR